MTNCFKREVSRMNFMSPCLSPSVSSSKPCADGYDIQNLISGTKGFMGAYFIRPPVDISVVFPVPIDISCIKMVARVEQKCSTGFLVFTEPEDISSSQSQNAAHPSQVSSSKDSSNEPSTSHGHSFVLNEFIEDSYKSSVTASDKDKDTSEIYLCVGKFYTKNEDELVLKNHHYRHWLRLPMPDTKSSMKGQSLFHGSLRHTNRKALKCVKSMLIRIQSTSERACPPVLHSLEVWGQPGISTNKSKRRELLKQWKTYKPITKVEPDVPRLYNSSPEEKMTEKSQNDDLNNRDLLEIPEDFLDPLTCDIMTVPLLLPSGNSIDAHTLERYIAGEATWGRPASDPFTGVPFRGDKQPVPNVSLKARIDRFLLANGEHPDIESCGRTVGSSLSSGEAGDSMNSANNKRVCLEYSGEDELDHPNNKRKVGRVEIDTKVIPVEGSSALDDPKNNSFDDLSMEIEAALKGKPKYLPTQMSTQKQKEDKEETGKVSLSSSTRGYKMHSKVLRAQTVKNKRDAVTRPGQCLSGPESSSSSHHGIVQMIGGILSVTQGRTARVKRLPAHHVNERPSHLIHGDKPSQNYTYPFRQSVSCSCGGTEALYKLDCEHLLCRTCLLKEQSHKAEVECGTCKRTCKKSSISKYHTKSIFST
ncbi:RING finger protein 37-like isoform X3 [Scylla paramamosain]